MRNEEALSVVRDRTLTFAQKVAALSKISENAAGGIETPESARTYIEDGSIYDMNEGLAPFRPRYVVPDYSKFISNGSEFLSLDPPENLDDAIDSLLVLYAHVPSITGYPVYVGKLDDILEPFVARDRDAYPKILRFLRHMDRTIADSFCQANIGPYDSETSRLFLRASRELTTVSPTICLLYDPSVTPEDFAADAASCALQSAKPTFANHSAYSADFPEGYAVVSCYNALRLGGGSLTLVRMNLARLSSRARTYDSFFADILPDAVGAMNSLMDARASFIVEESGYFDTSFLAAEGFTELSKYTSMFGIVGLAECANRLCALADGTDKPKPSDRFGRGGRADAIGLDVIEAIGKMVGAHKGRYCEGTGGRYLLHAQVGVDSDEGASPGCRIPIGEEPELHEHLAVSSAFHPYFPSGVGDVFAFEPTAKDNPLALVDAIKGAFAEGMRYASFYSSDSDVVRVSGYLVKKSEMDALACGKASLRDTTALGLGAKKNLRSFDRRVHGTP